VKCSGLRDDSMCGRSVRAEWGRTANCARRSRLLLGTRAVCCTPNSAINTQKQLSALLTQQAERVASQPSVSTYTVTVTVTVYAVGYALPLQ